MGFIQYLKDTRGELNHVAWPTRVQTIIYTILVISISIFIALYLGFFDYIFTSGLGRGLMFIPHNSIPTPTVEISTTTVGTTTSQ